jgi:hypothetical protein
VRINSPNEPTDEKERKAGNDIHDADHFVISRRDQPVDQIARWAGARRERTAGPKPLQRRRHGGHLDLSPRMVKDEAAQGA